MQIHWDPCILKLHVHLSIAGMRLHICMNEVTTHKVLVKPQCLHTGHTKQLTSR